MRKLLKGLVLPLSIAAAMALTACGSSSGTAQTTAAPAAETAAETTSAAAEADKETEAETSDEAKEAEKAEEKTDAAAPEKEEKEDKEASEDKDGASDDAELPDMNAIVTEPMTVKLGVPKAPPTLAILHMMEDGLLGDNVTIDLDIWDAPEKLLAMVQDGDHDMFAFPLTVVAKLYNKGLPVVLTNCNTWGVTYFMTTDPDFSDWSQLKGKTVYVPLQSSPPDALTQYFLGQAGLKIGEDVEIIYTTTAEVAQLLASGQAEYATLIEPQCTAAMIQNENVRVAMSFEDEWKKIKGEDAIVPNAGFGTTKAFIDSNPEFVAAFEAIYEDSLNWVLENPAEAAALAEKYLELKAKVVEKAIPNMGLMYENSLEAKSVLDDYYQLLNDFDQTMIGGKIPDEGMYYSR